MTETKPPENDVPLDRATIIDAHGKEVPRVLFYVGNAGGVVPRKPNSHTSLERIEFDKDDPSRIVSASIDCRSR